MEKVLKDLLEDKKHEDNIRMQNLKEQITPKHQDN